MQQRVSSKKYSNLFGKNVNYYQLFIQDIDQVNTSLPSSPSSPLPEHEYYLVIIGMIARLSSSQPGLPTLALSGLDLEGEISHPHVGQRYQNEDFFNLGDILPLSWVIGIPDNFPFVTRKNYNLDWLVNLYQPNISTYLSK